MFTTLSTHCFLFELQVLNVGEICSIYAISVWMNVLMDILDIDSQTYILLVWHVTTHAQLVQGVIIPHVRSVTWARNFTTDNVSKQVGVK